MKYQAATKKLEDLNRQLEALRQEIVKVRRAAEPQEMKDYSFTRSTGKAASWTDLFDEKDDLIVIHNMGRTCPNCTLWANGFNGVYDHLASRAPFAVATPDKPEAQNEFTAVRGWRFPMISYRGTSLAEDTGYGGDGGYYPGVSVVPEAERQGDAGFRHLLQARRSLLRRLAPLRPDPARLRRLAAQVQVLKGSIRAGLGVLFERQTPATARRGPVRSALRWPMDRVHPRNCFGLFHRLDVQVHHDRFIVAAHHNAFERLIG